MSEDPLAVTHFEAPSLEALDELFPGYEFEAFIAKGGMGAVYLANQTSLDRQVAIKILPREFGDDESFRKSFQTEAKLMAKLNHPNLIGIYDFGSVDGMLFIIMEFVKGKSLYHSAYGKAIVQEKAGEIIRDLCLGLDHAHDAGILHRDIKPANILLGKGAKPKIGDFGLARPAGNTETGIIYGTPGYAAPEVIAAPDTVDARTDIFAVGVILYELLAGHMPSAKNYESILEYSDCDPRFDNIIRKAINPKSARRYGTAAELAEDISEVLNDLKTKSASPQKSLLVTPKGATTAPARTLVAANTSTQTVKQTVTGSVSSPAASTSGFKNDAPPKASNPAIRNIIIILLLLGALAIALEFKDKKAKRIAEEQKLINAEKEKLEREKELAKSKLNSNDPPEQANNKDPKPNTGANQPPKNTTPAVVTNAGAIEKIESSKSSLKNGDRNKSLFPSTVFYRNNGARAMMFVETPMTWEQADVWAREHGGHIATCIGDPDVTELGRRLRDVTEEAWLGAGNNGDKGWVWSDGAEWLIRADFPKTNKRQFVKVNKHGYLGAESISKKLPFYIEWKMDGTNPGTIESRLQRVSDDIENRELNPSFPPGTLNVKNRTYTIINQATSYSQAYKLASVSGGHLLVISNKAELADLENSISRSAPELSGKSGWLGAEKDGHIWKWSTNEKWIPLQWAPNHPKNETKLALKVIQNKIKILDTNSRTKIPFFIIEWSNDKDRKVSDSSNDINSASSTGVTNLKEKARELLKKQLDDTEKLHVSNIKRLSFNLGFYINSLAKSEKDAQQGQIDRLMESLLNIDRLPRSIDNSGPTKRVKDYTKYAYSKQVRIEKEHKEAITKLRQAYRKQLFKLKEKALKAGQKSVANSIDKTVKNLGQSNIQFQSHLGL